MDQDHLVDELTDFLLEFGLDVVCALFIADDLHACLRYPVHELQAKGLIYLIELEYEFQDSLILGVIAL